MTAGTAWYERDRAAFLSDDLGNIVAQLASAAAAESLHIEADQHEEWISSVGLLQTQLAERARVIEILREALKSPSLADYGHVILEYDLRRRGLRLDCVLLGEGIVVVVEFKRSEIAASDRDQVTNYCINLVEFHEETRRLCQLEKCIVVPVLALTQGSAEVAVDHIDVFHNPPWAAVLREPLQCDASRLHQTLLVALDARRGRYPIERKRWLEAPFSPSSTIIDAAISLYGQHDVSAIKAHAAPIDRIDKCTEEVAKFIALSRKDKESRVIFISGAPGAGKTLVGLKLAFDPRFRENAVFVTGNAPLVDVLSEALKNSYRSGGGRRSDSSVKVVSGYAREDAYRVIEMSTFKIVKAHAFLGARGKKTGSTDGSVVIFDEAQRTYEKGREVLRKKLEDDEANLVLGALEQSYGPGAVVVALLGHNQAINRGEMGVVPWFKAAKSRGWRYAISDETLELSEVANSGAWTREPNRDVLVLGHLPHSLRYYRNRHRS